MLLEWFLVETLFCGLNFFSYYWRRTRCHMGFQVPLELFVHEVPDLSLNSSIMMRIKTGLTIPLSVHGQL